MPGLNIHAAPKAKARIIGHAPHNARDLANLGGKGTASLSDWLKMQGAPRRAAASKAGAAFAMAASKAGCRENFW